MGVLLVFACDPDESVPDAGPAPTDSGSIPAEDGGADAGRRDAGTDGGSGADGGDAGTGGTDGGTQGPAACERTAGVCAGAARAQVDGGYEPVCTVLSYGSDYEQVETRCDGLDNDCDGVADPTHWSRVTELAAPVHGGGASSLRVDGGVLVAVASDSANEARILRLDTRLMPQGTSSVPLERTDGGLEYVRRVTLLHTTRGPALHYVMRRDTEGPSQTYMAPLDEMGAPAPLPDGGTGSMRVLEEPAGGVGHDVEASPDGTRLLFVWGVGLRWQGFQQVMGLLTDAEGQVIAGPKELFRATVQGRELFISDVLFLRNGEAAVAAQEELDRSTLYEDLVRIHRFDSRLDPVGRETSFRAWSGTQARLVDMGPEVGDPLVSPLLVMRQPAQDSTYFKLQTVSGLFEGGSTPRTWVETTRWEAVEDREIPWFDVSVGESGLRFAWLAKRYNPRDGTHSGRFWTWEEGGTARDRTPGPERLPLHNYAQWVLREELGGGQQGALLMTSSASRHSLEAVRYCAP
jgi:hypothetical protein